MRHSRIIATLGFLSVVLLAACSGGSAPTAPVVPTTGTLSLRLDGQTCSGTRTITIFVDGTSQGAYAFTGGQTKSFTASAGAHLVGATESGPFGLTWPSQNVFVPAGSSYTVLLTC